MALQMMRMLSFMKSGLFFLGISGCENAMELGFTILRPVGRHTHDCGCEDDGHESDISPVPIRFHFSRRILFQPTRG